MNRLYGIANCDTMKKARAWLTEHDVACEFHDYKKLGIDEATLSRWAQVVGWEVLLNRRGTTWRKLPEGVRDGVDEAKAIQLMAEQPSLIKRPVLDKDGAIHVGFAAERYAELFG
jgi:Spx/MgsR family transcriptional regulator